MRNKSGIVIDAQKAIRICVWLVRCNPRNGRLRYVEHPRYICLRLAAGKPLENFEVLAAEDSEKGCKLAATERPDVILMDLEMPVVDRWEPVRALKNNPQTRDIPIIGMSAYAIDSEREQAIAAGCDEFAAKPIEFEHLVAAIRRVLATRNNSPALLGRVLIKS